jgi:CubicO group peptidase (beta-lactamase class C family)
MAVASVSKSITAAAVVKLLADNGVAITQEFPLVAGLAGDWPEQKSKPVPRVVDVLRNIGGFASAGAALFYDDHAKISALGYGAMPITEDEYLDFVVGEQLLNAAGQATPYDHWSEDYLGAFRYSNPGFSALGELVRIQSGVPYEQYVRTTMLEPLGLDDSIFADRGNRNTVDPTLASGPVPLGRFEPVKSELRKYLINTAHPYVCADNPPCTPKLPPSDSSPSPGQWTRMVGPGDPSAPINAGYERYAGSLFMGGAPLAAGGWHGDGKSLGELMRAIARTSLLMPNDVAAQLWSPQWQIFQVDQMAIPAPDWAYGLGWYVRGNWVAWIGGTNGGSGLVLHNLEYDFTVVALTNLIDNSIGLVNPLLTPVCYMDTPNCWGTSTLGALFPCWDDPNTVADECPVQIIY